MPQLSFTNHFKQLKLNSMQYIETLYKKRNKLENMFKFLVRLNPESKQTAQYIENKLLLIDTALLKIENKIFLQAN